jgi:hypothetical protein
MLVSFLGEAGADTKGLTNLLVGHARRRSYLVFWAIFWYKGGCQVGRMEMVAVISPAVRIGIN